MSSPTSNARPSPDKLLVVAVPSPTGAAIGPMQGHRLGLGACATRDVGAGAGTVMAVEPVTAEKFESPE